MTKRLLQIAILATTLYFMIDAGQRTGWSLKVYAGALIALALTILTIVVKDYWIINRLSRRVTDAR
ncbi:MAG: hypothetical protein K0Q60_4571 [Microvirga sp.]|jgi:hypothetical protein|nr:hypothetical protein [Microvirga sp.]